MEIYADRIEVSNPGGLPPGMLPSDLGRKGVRRNPLIADLLQRIDLIEKVDTGIRRMREEAPEPKPALPHNPTRHRRGRALPQEIEPLADAFLVGDGHASGPFIEGFRNILRRNPFDSSIAPHCDRIPGSLVSDERLLHGQDQTLLNASKIVHALEGRP